MIVADHEASGKSLTGRGLLKVTPQGVRIDADDGGRSILGRETVLHRPVAGEGRQLHAMPTVAPAKVHQPPEASRPGGIAVAS